MTLGSDGRAPVQNFQSDKPEMLLTHCTLALRSRIHHESICIAFKLQNTYYFPHTLALALPLSLSIYIYIHIYIIYMYMYIYIYIYVYVSVIYYKFFLHYLQ